MNKKRAFILICILLFATMLSGFDKRTVELQNNSNMPLIDLDKAIDRAKWGSDSEAGSDTAQNEKSETVSADKVSGNGAISRIDTNKEFAIRVRGKRIILDGMELKSADILEKRLAAEYKKGDSVRITDDYADADTYREVLKVLSDLAETKGLVYSGDYVEK